MANTKISRNTEQCVDAHVGNLEDEPCKIILKVETRVKSSLSMSAVKAGTHSKIFV